MGFSSWGSDHPSPLQLWFRRKRRWPLHSSKNETRFLVRLPNRAGESKTFSTKTFKIPFLLRSGIYKLEFSSSSNKDVFHDDIYLVHTLKKACDLLHFSWQSFSFIHMYFGLSLTFCLLFLNLHVSHKYRLFFFLFWGILYCDIPSLMWFNLENKKFCRRPAWKEWMLRH